MYGVSSSSRSRPFPRSRSVPSPLSSRSFAALAACRLQDVAMLCERPFVGSFGHEHPCGRCLPCKVNKNRVWQSRLALELGLHDLSTFVTLTYKVDPVDLVRSDLTLFLKRLRKAIEPRRLRFYAVGEYGSKNGRAHFHLLIFGVSWTEDQLIADCWKLGGIHCGDVNSKTIGYITNYLLVKDTHGSNIREDGRVPEFHTMSKNPGIGSDAAAILAKSVVSSDGEVYLRDGDVPCTIRMEGKEKPLGTFLMKRFRSALGRPVDVPRETGLLRTLRNSAESAEVRENRRRNTAASTAARVKINQSKRYLK